MSLFFCWEIEMIDLITKEQMRTYKAEGHTNREVADKFGMNYETTKVICRGIASQSNKIDKFGLFMNHFKEYQDRWEYVGGFTSGEGKVLCRCKTCGEVSEFWCSLFRHRGLVACRPCIEHKRQAKLEMERIQDEQEKARRAEAKRIKDAMKEWQKIFARHKCPVCGEYTDRQKYCSEECMNKANEKRKETKRRLRLSSQMVDRDITLDMLYERDGGKCWLCGCQCDKDDYTKGDYFIAGNNYPSIDHVIPLAKGGEHSWENVRLAHRRCNSLKADSIAPFV
jgi:uncharacterized Zn finger protein (UPF0148 family)